MKRLVFCSALLFFSIMLWSSTSSANSPNGTEARAFELCNNHLFQYFSPATHECKRDLTTTNIVGFFLRNSTNGRLAGFSFIMHLPGYQCAYGYETTPQNTTICSLEPVAPVCTSDTIPGFGLYGSNPTGDVITIGDTGPRIANVNSCAYTCYVNYDLLDGFTTFGAAHQCTGLSQPYVDQEPSSYTDPEVCSVRDNLGRCLELSAQTGACPAGTTYGRVNEIDVCVPSGTSTAATDTGSTGVPDAGGSQQATGTADVAGTGGLSTGSTTSTSTSSSTTTLNPDGTSTTEGTETEETAGPKTFGGHGDPKSWWVSKYPAGVSGIADNFSYSVQTSAIMDVLNPLTSLPNSGSEPVWSMSFNLGPLGNYGVSDFRVPEGVWLFVRFCLFFTATFVAQRIVFGGG